MRSDDEILAFVAGATGYTGRHVVQELARRKVPVRAHVRPGSSSLDEWTRRFDKIGAVVDSAPWRPEAMRNTLATHRPSHVFSLLGTTRAKARADRSGASSYQEVDYALSTMLLDAAIQSGANPCFIFLSSLGATAGAGNEYLRVRGMVEERIKQSGLPYLIVRPAIITGPDREESRFVERTSAVLSDSLLGFAALLGAGRWRARYASMTGRDLGKGIVHFAIEHRREQGAGQVITFEEIRAHMTS